MQILVADDNPVNQIVAQGLLKHLGHGCNLVPDGVDVLEAFKKQSYDVVFMNLEMTHMGGADTCPGQK